MKVKGIYLNYPQDPGNLDNWLVSLVAKYNEYRFKLKLPPQSI